jgi:capsular polysaccharide biosynthesis protein
MPQGGGQAGPADPAGSAWVRQDLKVGSERGSREFALGLASLGFIGRALRRRARLLVVFGFIGMLVGAGFYVKAPPPYQAQATVLLDQPSTVNPLDALQTDVTLAQTQGVAGAALRKLGLAESVTTFLKSFTVVAVTDGVVQFTVGAPTTSDAVARANALATAFLNFRDEQLEIQQRLFNVVLVRETSQAQKAYAALEKKYQGIQAMPASATKTADLQYWSPRLRVADLRWTGLQDELTSGPTTTQALILGSKVIDPGAPLPRSHIRTPALYALAGLIGGLAAGVGYVVFTGLISDRLRLRDDVARALGTPVRLSVRAVKFGRWPRRGGIQAVRRAEVQKMAASLRTALPPRKPGVAATLAVVAVDDARLAALPVLSLAVSAARAGSQVIVADLTAHATAAKLLGVSNTGVLIVSTGGQEIVLVVPERGDLTPAGPLHRASAPVPVGSTGRGARWSSQGQDFSGWGNSDPAYRDRLSRRQSFVSQGITGPLTAAFGSSDLMLTVATLDPALGADHLPGWADKAAVVVSAGAASATSIHAVGEMLRLAGLPASGAILVGADKSDLSAGAVPAQAASHRTPARRPPSQPRPQKPAPQQGTAGA